MENVSLKYKHHETGLEFEVYEKTNIAVYVNNIRAVVYHREDFEGKCKYRNLQHLFFWNIRKFEETCNSIAEVWKTTGMLLYQKKLTTLQNLMKQKEFYTTNSKFGNQNCHSASSNATSGLEFKYKDHFFKRILQTFHIEYFFIFTKEEERNLSTDDKSRLEKEYPFRYEINDMAIYTEKKTNVD